MSLEFTVYRGSADGAIVEAKTKRELGPTQAYIQITHAGVCGTDEHYLHSGIVLGHEGIGIIKDIGSQAAGFKVGDRVGFGWFSKNCGHCENCLNGQDQYCETVEQFGFNDTDVGAFGSHAVKDVSWLFHIPDGLASEDAAPMMCAGATVWSPLFAYGVKPSDRIGIIGVGGLGHLAIQFAAKMGCEVVVFSGTDSKKELATKLGATEFHAVAGRTDLSDIKKVQHLLITTSEQPNYDLYLSVVSGTGSIYPLTVSFDKSPIPLLKVLTQGINIQGSAGASRRDMNRLLNFVATQGIKPTLMKWPLSREGVEESMKTLREGKMRFKGVLVAP